MNAMRVKHRTDENPAYRLGLAMSRYQNMIMPAPPEVCIALLQEIVACANAEIARLREQMSYEQIGERR
ncbi:MAG: hypothetical protein QXS54_03675 [Candidatus Methanomethylicaceae archaeon]